MIEINELTKKFRLNKQQKKKLATANDYIYAVDGITLKCQPGRIFSLLGPNGAGKTTTLRLIATILRPSSGTITVGGLDTQKDGAGVRQRMGFLTGTTGLYDRLTPDELVTYFGKLYGMNGSVLERRKQDLFHTLEISGFSGKRIGELSSGMKQKVSIARTMVHDPEVVVFDEPTAGLDVITAEHIIDLIRQCKDEGKTVIFSSHIMSEVDLLCDDLAIIHEGKILFDGAMDHFRGQMVNGSLTQEFIRIVNNAKTQTK
jgi:sodium transport system ATP-binding protein